MALLRTLQSRTGVADLALAAIFWLLIVIEIWYIDGGRSTPAAVAATLLAVCAAGAVAFARFAPIPAFAVNGAAVASLIAFTEATDFYQWTQLLCLVFVAIHVRDWWAWIALPLSLAAVALYFERFPSEVSGRASIFAISLLWAAVWLFGRVYGGANERGMLRQERDLSVAMAEAQQAKVELEADRRMLAQEVHDIVGHSLNVMLVHAGGARLALAKDPAQAEQALNTIEATGREALADLDRVLGLLQPTAAEDELGPQPGLENIETLVANASTTGLTVNLSLEVDAAAVPRAQQLTLYRVAQEAITNVMKHAQAQRATIAIEASDNVVSVTVIDDGKGLGRSKPGRGRRGMEARAEALGGTFVTQTHDDGGTMVRCTLPLSS